MATKLLPISVLNERKPATSKLTAVRYLERHQTSSGHTKSRIECICVCGNIKNAVLCDFLRGNPQSCGCSSGKKGAKNKYKYGGKENKRLLQTWYDLIERHTNTKHVSFKYYGGKGCVICPQWYDYDTFAEWAINNGYDKTKQIDKDIKGNGLLYSPDTCLWVTAKQNQQEKNKRLGITKRNEKTGRFST